MRGRVWWIVAIPIVLGAPIAWYLGSPLFINRTVVEEFPEYLSSHPSPRTREQVHEGVVNLGRLKGNMGAQNYAVPAGADLARVRSVVIYCQRFHVLFATASLQSAP